MFVSSLKVIQNIVCGTLFESVISEPLTKFAYFVKDSPLDIDYLLRYKGLTFHRALCHR